MRNHTLNLFRINNLFEFNFSYKLIDFDLQFIEGKEDWFNKQLQKIALKVSSVTGGPAALVNHTGKYRVAIPVNRDFVDCKIDLVPFAVNLKLLNDIHQILPGKIDNSNWEIVQKFLEFDIRTQLTNHNQLWKLNNNQFFPKKPIHQNDGSTISIFSGFAYKVVRLADGNFYIVLDLTSKYIDKHCLSHYVNEDNALVLAKQLKGKRFLYLNGNDWYTTELMGFAGPVKDHEITRDGKTYNLFEYIKNKLKYQRSDGTPFVKATDMTMLYKYPGRVMEPHKGAASLARMLYHTNDPKVKALHGYSIKDPSKRMEIVGKFITQYFQNLKFNSTAISISKNPLVEQVRNFSIPDLKYNNNKVLKVGNYANGGNTSLSDFGRERKSLIVKNGILNKSPFDEQYLIVPEYLDKNLVEAFKKNAEYQIKQLAPAFSSFKVIRYKVQENVAATTQIVEIEKVLRQQNALAGFALFILPDLAYDSERQISRFHDCLKNKFYPDLKLQCASAAKISSFFHSYTTVKNNNSLVDYKIPEENKPKFRSYMFNLAMEHLNVNRKWPFALAKNLHYDIYIGIDVHDRYAGFTFFFKNGEHIIFFSKQVPPKSKGQRAEKLKYALLYPMIYEQLKVYIPHYCPNPNGIIILRDGKSFSEEEKSLSSAIKTLATDGLLDASTIKSAVVDLHKSSMIPLRIASQTNGHNGLENPIAGAYKLFNPKEGFLFNTGYPFKIRGSVKPLHLSIRYGDAEFVKILEDVFCQCTLAFSAPDRANSLPIIIKLIDTLLEPLAGLSSFAEYEEEEENDDIEEIAEISLENN